jgi:hypothetical protein
MVVLTLENWIGLGKQIFVRHLHELHKMNKYWGEGGRVSFSSCPPASFISESTWWISINHGIEGLHWKLQCEFNFGSYRSNKTLILCENQSNFKCGLRCPGLWHRVVLLVIPNCPEGALKMEAFLIWWMFLETEGILISDWYLCGYFCNNGFI